MHRATCIIHSLVSCYLCLFCFPRPWDTEQPSVRRDTSCAVRREEAGRPRGFREADRHAAVLWAASRTEENLFLCSSFSPFWWAGWAGVLISVLRLPSPLLPHSLSFLPFACFILVILASRVHRTFRKLRMLFLPFFFSFAALSLSSLPLVSRSHRSTFPPFSFLILI